MTRGRRIALAAAAVLVLLPVMAAGGLAALFDPDALKLRLADAVRRSTGRELAVAGPVGLTWSLVPTIALHDVSLSNPPGMSRLAMARAAEVDVRIALVPLLSRRVEVRGITLVEPDVLLERDAAGQANWRFAPPAASSAVPAPAGPPAARMRVAVDAVRVRDGRVGWRTGAGVIELRAPEVTAAAAGPDDPVALTGTLSLAGLGLNMTGTTGPLTAIGAAAWPIRVGLQGGGLQAGANGTLGRDGALALKAKVADLAVLEPALRRTLPPLHDLQASARLSVDGVADIHVQAGAADLSGWLPGVKLTQLTLTAPAMAQPVTAAAAAAADVLAGTAPVAAAATVDSLAALLAGGAAPGQLTLTAAGATLEAEGDVAGLMRRDVDLTVSARVPDMMALGALAGLALPPVRDATLEARASATAAGTLALRGVRLASPQGDVSGDLVLGRTPRPSVRGTLVSQRLDLGALLARPALVPPSEPAPAVPAAPAPAATPASSTARVLPDRPLPFYLLWRADADLQMTLNEVVWHGASYRSVTGRMSLQDGTLRLDPVQAQAPGGPMQATVLADAAAPVPTVQFGLKAPNLAVGPFLAGFGAPESMEGRVDADVQLKGSGGSVRAIAASLDGHLGLALVDGELDNVWIAGLLGDALRGMPMELSGRSAVRCLALRLDATQGQATARALLLDATRLHLEGEGGLSLADETLDLRLRTLVRLGGTWVSVPVHLAGPWRTPRPQVAAGGRGALVIGAAPGADACPAQLAVARGQAGPVPAASPAPTEAPRGLKPADLLRSLLR